MRMKNVWLNKAKKCLLDTLLLVVCYIFLGTAARIRLIATMDAADAKLGC